MRRSRTYTISCAHINTHRLTAATARTVLGRRKVSAALYKHTQNSDSFSFLSSSLNHRMKGKKNEDRIIDPINKSVQVVNVVVAVFVMGGLK
jgi:hypothetical protein